MASVTAQQVKLWLAMMASRIGGLVCISAIQLAMQLSANALWKTAVTGSLPPVWVARIEFLNAGFTLAQIGFFQPLVECTSK